MMFLTAVVTVIIIESVCVSGKQTQGVRDASISAPPDQPLPFEQVNYSMAILAKDYNSSTKHHSKGMGHLYFITRSFMNLIFPGELFPEG